MFSAHFRVGLERGVIGAIISQITSLLIMATAFGTCWGNEKLRDAQEEVGHGVHLEIEEAPKDYVKFTKAGKSCSNGNSASDE